MSKRYWIAGLALGLVFFCTILAVSAYLHYYYHAQYRAIQRERIESQHSQNDRQYAPVAQFWRWYASLYGKIESRDRERAEQHDEEDLIAQQDMAEWAFWLLLASVTGLIVSVSGLAALFVSLYQTRTAIKDNRVIGEAQVRCYLSIRDVYIAFGGDLPGGASIKPGDASPDQLSPTIFLDIENHGQSPAKRVLWTPSIMYGAVFKDDAGVTQLLERQSGRNFPIDRNDRTWGEFIAAGKELSLSTSYGFGMNAFEQSLIRKPRKEGQVIVVLVIGLLYEDVFENITTEEYGYSCSISQYVSGGKIRMKPQPVWMFETQEALRARHEAEKQKAG